MSNNIVLQRDDLRLTVKDAEGRCYLDLPVVAVTSGVEPFGISNVVSLPPGDGPLYVVCARGPAVDPDDV